MRRVGANSGDGDFMVNRSMFLQDDDRWMREMDGEAIGSPCFCMHFVVRPDWVDNGPQRAQPFP